MPSDRMPSVSPAHALTAGSSFLPAKAGIAIVCMTAATRRSYRGNSGLKPTEAIIRLRRRSVEMLVWTFTILASSLFCIGAAGADRPAPGA
jgi:hypothetical protein